jgi:UDP-N-acetylmuramoylalanine--D-glutamate ligase
MQNDWQGKRVTILGGARQGQAVARWLARHGARVTVNDRLPSDQMASAQAALKDLPVSWVLDGHPVEILDTTDVLFLSGGVPLENPIVMEAARRGIPVTNDTQLFMETVPCRTIGITGSAGKTTTTAIVGQMAKVALGNKAYVGGNIGDPLLNYVDGMKPDDLAVLEISSFQLEQMTLSPKIAAVLNITPNHLDRHSTMTAYTATKKRILDFQPSDGIAILNREDSGSWDLHGDVKCRLLTFGFGPLKPGQDGSFLSEGWVKIRIGGLEIPLFQRDQIQLRGDHNLMNILAAFTIGVSASLPLDALRAAAREFKGVPHRLELVREWNNVRWYNDSIATAPERTMAAIRSFDEPIVLLLGGRDKNLPWDELADLVHRRVGKVVIFGEAAEKISQALENAHGPRKDIVERCKGLEDAVHAASRLMEPGEVVLLSPGGTSFDQFRDFEERGEAFRKWVSELS